jgi:hypothetical protein
MRQERTVQASIFDLYSGHEIGRELKAMSRWLDDYPVPVEQVANDLRRDEVKDTGRQGLPAASVIRCGLLKQHCQLSYEKVALSSRRLHLVPRLRSPAGIVDAEEVGPAQDNQRDPSRDMGGNQPGCGDRCSCARDQDRQGAPAGQHGHGSAHPRPKRQQPSVGCCPGDVRFGNPSCTTIGAHRRSSGRASGGFSTASKSRRARRLSACSNRTPRAAAIANTATNSI